jgi:GAF domain-containing protein
MNKNSPFRVAADQQENPETSAFDYKGWRELFITTVLRIACVLGVALMVVSFPTATNTDKIIFVGLYIFLLAITLLRVPYSVRAFSLLFMVFTVGTNSILAWGPWLDGSIFFIAFIVLSALLFDQRVDIYALIISILTFAIISTLHQIGVFELRAPNAPSTSLADWVAYTMDFSIISAVLIFAIGQFKDAFIRIIQEIQNAFNILTTERSRLEERVRERTEELENRASQLRSSAAVARTIAEMQDITELMEATTKLTSEQFGYYNASLYLLDERKKIAFLQASSSSAGQQLVGQAFRVEPDRSNILNQVIEQNRPVATSDIDANFVRDPNFPLTRSRLVLPLTVRNNVIGVMDIHSDQVQTFSTQDAEIMQTLADLVAISIDNVRLINETKSLVLQLEATTSTQTHETWSKYTSRQRPAFQYTPAGVRPLFSNTKLKDKEGLHIPMVLHGQKIGEIMLKRKGVNAEWSDRERVLVEKVADQVALALENSRLVDETQKNALRNQVIANISTRVRETLDVESVIRTAAVELRRVFDLKETEISIGTSQTDGA